MPTPIIPPHAPDDQPEGYAPPTPAQDPPVGGLTANQGREAARHAVPPPARPARADASSDARLIMADAYAQRGLTYASINDLARAVVLMVDMQKTPEPGRSIIGRAAERGEAPPLFAKSNDTR